MSLRVYRKKRTFSKTPEPKGDKQKSNGPLRFVIQKHHASQLHYDFRLELDGVLKSWAVPKGPSLNPEDKRLAMMVEDHPLAYAQFEGIIPKGNYGGGTVMVWDTGVYASRDVADPEKEEKNLKEQLKKGHMTFLLLGKKLQGEFALIKSPHLEKNAWLLIKKDDEYASKKDILQENRSSISGRSMEEIEREAVRKKKIWISTPKSLHIADLPKGQMPHGIKPMLADAIDEPFDNSEWLFEMKYDGYRAIAEITKSASNLYSRNQQSYNQKFSPVVQALTKFPGEAVLDGEVVSLEKNGHPNFGWLQDYPHRQKGELVYFIFDILYYNGHNVTTLPLYRRKEILKQLLPPLPHIIYSDHIEETGVEMFIQATKLGLEGVMAKKRQSLYKQGVRSSEWLKIKIQNRQETIIAGFTNPKGSRKYFGALVLGVYKQGKLSYIGHTGGGFSNQKLKDIFNKLQPLIQPNCPFDTKPETNAPVTWVKPIVIAEVAFSSWTENNQMRHPVFLGLREDKKPTEVEAEKIFSRNPIQKEEKEITIDSQKIRLTNLTKIFWPNEKYTKADIVNYYREIAPVILPHLKNRPESLLRYPDGINDESFFQKDASNLDAHWIKRATIHSDSGEKDIEYLLCQNEAALVYIINLGCIDVNPWSSRIHHVENPDYLVIDLDPYEIDFLQVIQAAQAARELLEQVEIKSFCKTSGASGLHIYIPMGAQYTYDQTRQLAELLCIQIHNKIPHITSLIRNPNERKGLVYLDFLQNGKGKTLASVYSVRAQPSATVSTPLLWSEVTNKLHPSQFTIKNTLTRIQKHGDIFKDILKKGIDMNKSLNNISNLSYLKRQT